MLLPLIVALIPLIIAPGLLFYYDVTPKIALLLLGVGAALPWFAPRKLPGRWFGALLIAQALSLILSTSFSSRAGLSIFGTNWRRYGLVTQLAMLLFTALAAADLAGGRLRSYMRAIATSAIPVSLYGIAQYFGWDPWIPQQAYHVGQDAGAIVRPPSTLGYVSYFASYLVFAVFFGAALYSIEERGWWKRAGAVAATLAAIAILLSGTRAAMLALLVGGGYLWFWLGRRVRMRVAAMAAAALAAVALFYFSPAGHILRSRSRWYAEDAWGGARLLLWRDSLSLAASHWFVGAGPETFSSEFPHFQSAALSRAYPDFYYESAHNVLLDALTAQGVLGLLALLGFIAVGFYQARNSRGTLAGILGACLVAGLTASQFSVFTVPTALCFYLTVAMLVALGKDSALAPRLPLAAALPVSAVLIALAVRLVVADHFLFQVKSDLEAGSTSSVAERYQRVRNWGLTADIWYSRRMAAAALEARDPIMALRDWQQALEAGFRATKTAEDPHNAWYNQASLHARQNDFEPTERCLREAVASSPNWFKPHWMLAQVWIARGRSDQALAEARLAARLNGGKNPEVDDLLQQLLRKK